MPSTTSRWRKRVAPKLLNCSGSAPIIPTKEPAPIVCDTPLAMTHLFHHMHLGAFPEDMVSTPDPFMANMNLESF
jgi:hypothetical protein